MELFDEARPATYCEVTGRTNSCLPAGIHHQKYYGVLPLDTDTQLCVSVFPMENPTENGYVECGECGHQIEQHGSDGCTICDCAERWTVAEIKRVRVREGLAAEWRETPHTPEPRSIAHNANARTGVYLGDLRDV